MAFIYVMMVGADLIKIGFANDPAKRLRELQRQVGRPMVIYSAFDCREQDHRQIERTIHAALKDRCVYREVFSMTPREALPHVAAAFGLTGHALADRLWTGDRPKPERGGEGAETEQPQITPCVCRAARAANGWTISELAKLSGVSKNTISGFESGQKQTNASCVLAIQRVLDTGRCRWCRDGNRVGLRWDDEPGGPPLLPSALPD